MPMTKEQFQQKVFTQSEVVSAPKVVEYGTEISPHIHAGPDHVWSPDTREVVLMPQLTQLFEEVRTSMNRPIQVDGGYRTIAYEDELTARGYQTASFVSPHSLASALDIKLVPQESEKSDALNKLLRMALRVAAKKLKLPQPRIGHRAYAEVFCHVDFVFALFAPFTALPHPSAWTELQPELREAYGLVYKAGIEW